MSRFTHVGPLAAITSMRIIPVTIITLLIFSCSSNTQKEQTLTQKKEEKLEPVEVKEPKEEVIELNELEQNEADYTQLDSTIREDIKDLDRRFKSTPFYVNLEGKNFYIICSGKRNNQKDEFDGTLKYGLTNDSLQTLLETEYDKIHNPNLAIKNCFEIERNSKVGLINYLTGDILQPQFEFILPSSTEPNEIAFGLHDGKWFKIESSKISLPSETDFDPIPILKTLSFDIRNIGENMMFDSYWKYAEVGDNLGRGVVLLPSYVSYFGLLDRDFTHIILPDQEGRIDFGTEQARLATSYRRSLSEKLVAFFVSAYESGIGVRGYEQSEAKQLIVHNEATNSLHSIHLGSLGQSDYFCREAIYRFENDSIVEVKTNLEMVENEKQRYDFETHFTYHKIEEDGTIKELTSNRYYDFTKFILIDENNLKGCFAWSIQDASYPEENMWIADYLSIEDLDLMRNEIFAEYGYKFKTDKWRKYFSEQPWYRPKYDDVHDRLTEMDKSNVKLILEIKEQLK